MRFTVVHHSSLSSFQNHINSETDGVLRSWSPDPHRNGVIIAVYESYKTEPAPTPKNNTPAPGGCVSIPQPKSLSQEMEELLEPKPWNDMPAVPVLQHGRE